MKKIKKEKKTKKEVLGINLFFFGFIITLGGVGGMETSSELFPLGSTVATIVGILLALAGEVLLKKVEQDEDE